MTDRDSIDVDDIVDDIVDDDGTNGVNAEDTAALAVAVEALLRDSESLEHLAPIEVLLLQELMSDSRRLRCTQCRQWVSQVVQRIQDLVG
jgi:hypothetical protein